MNHNDQNFIVEKIRTQYVEKESTKLDELVELDARVKRPADTLGYTTGTVGTLVLGAGMSMVMTAPALMAAGVVAGVAGIAITALNYPFYKRFLAKRRQKYAPEVLRLSQEIAAQDECAEVSEAAQASEDAEAGKPAVAVEAPASEENAEKVED